MEIEVVAYIVLINFNKELVSFEVTEPLDPTRPWLTVFFFVILCCQNEICKGQINSKIKKEIVYNKCSTFIFCFWTDFKWWMKWMLNLEILNILILLIVITGATVSKWLIFQNFVHIFSTFSSNWMKLMIFSG